MRKYIPHILIISFVLLLAPTAHVASYAGAIEDAKEEVSKNPDDAGAHTSLGVAYYILGKYEEAIESFKQAIRIKPDYADAHYCIGLAYVQINDRGSAMEQYKILKKLNTRLANDLFNVIYE